MLILLEMAESEIWKQILTNAEDAFDARDMTKFEYLCTDEGIHSYCPRFINGLSSGIILKDRSTPVAVLLVKKNPTSHAKNTVNLPSHPHPQ